MSRFESVLFLIILVLSSSISGNASVSHGGHVQGNIAIAPPVKPVRVSIGARLIKVFYVEAPATESPQLKARFRLRIEWRDERLAEWQEDSLHLHEYQDDDAALQLTKMFNPGIEVANGTFETEHLHLRIYRYGTVALTHVMDVTVPANMLLTHFPFDSQIFAFRFASAYWNEDELDLKLNSLESGMEPDKDALKTWHFGFNSNYISRTRVGSHEEEHAVLNFFLHAERDPDYFIWRLLIPLLAMVFLSWNVFWMFEDASSAFSNCIVFLLTVVAFHQIANSMLPVIPYFTFLDSIVFVSYGFIIIPTFQVMVASKLEFHGRTKEAAEIRRYCRFVVPVVFIITMLTIVLFYFAKPL